MTREAWREEAHRKIAIDKNIKVPMRVVEFVTDTAHRGRRGSPAIPAGTTLYAIAYNRPGFGYFPYSYQSKSDAQRVLEGMVEDGTDNLHYFFWNVKRDAQETLHVAPRKGR